MKCEDYRDWSEKEVSLTPEEDERLYLSQRGVFSFAQTLTKLGSSATTLQKAFNLLGQSLKKTQITKNLQS